MKFDNVKVNTDENSVEISVNSQIFSIAVVMKALLDFSIDN
jgi:hypothetical protein